MIEKHPTEESSTVCPSCKVPVNFNSDGEQLYQHYKACLLRKLADKQLAKKQRTKELIEAGVIEPKAVALVCQDCGKVFDAKHKLTRHVEDVHAMRFKFACEKCEYVTNVKQAMQKHERTHLRKDGLEIDEQNRSLYIYCHICAKRFTCPSFFKTHMRLKHQEGDIVFYSCDECDERFPAKSLVKKHKIVKHSDDPAYECDVCGYRGMGHELKAHKATHLAPKFPCNFCGKSLKSKASLDAHSRIHTGENPFM